MPYFDEYGGDEWICQICGLIYNSRVTSHWMTPVPGKQFNGNVCPNCYNQHVDQEMNEKLASKEFAIPVVVGTREEDRPRTRVSRRLKTRFINPLDYADNPAELEVQRELARMGIENEPPPETCPCLENGIVCEKELESHSGMVGEPIRVCPDHFVVWEDREDAIRRVI